MRTRRLEIRFTHDEANWIVSRARARGLSLTDYVRSAALRGSGTTLLACRRRLPIDTAIPLRQLTDVAAELRRLHKENEYLRRQREILKKAMSILSEDPQCGMR